MSASKAVARTVAIALFVLTCAVAAFAHGGHEHIRGVVTKVSADSITVQTGDNATKTFSVSPKTTVEQAGKPAQIADVKVGDRIIVEVPPKKTEAALIRIG